MTTVQLNLPLELSSLLEMHGDRLVKNNMGRNEDALSAKVHAAITLMMR
jgi:hypothetical protein